MTEDKIGVVGRDNCDNCGNVKCPIYQGRWPTRTPCSNLKLWMPKEASE
jgi:hypothetical protein